MFGSVLPPTGGGSLFGRGEVADRVNGHNGSHDKLSRCNAAFAAWLRRQRDEAPSVPWTDGVRDYIAYAEPLAREQPRPPPARPPPERPPPQDEDAMPREAPEEVLRGEDGDETQVAAARAAIRRLDKTDDGPTWRDLGKGQARVMRHNATRATRVVVRNDAGKVILNFALDPTMKFFADRKAGLKFTALDATSGAQNFLLRTKPPLTADDLHPASIITA